MTARIVMIRHGAHDLLGRILCGRTVDVGLNQAGEAQALAVAVALAGLRVTAMQASPLRRARQTAAPIAAACGLAVVETGALNEIDCGGWSGATFDALQGDPRWQGWNTDRLHHRPPGGESMLEVQTRVAAWIDRLAAADGATVAAVSHADVIKAAVCHVLGLSVDQHDRFDIDPGSMTTLIAGDWGIKIVAMNERPTIPG